MTMLCCVRLYAGVVILVTAPNHASGLPQVFSRWTDFLLECVHGWFA